MHFTYPALIVQGRFDEVAMEAFKEAAVVSPF
jgi:hypothetical protein